MGRMKYVQRRANRFEFRYPLPDDVAGKPVPSPWPEPLALVVNQRTGRFKTELVRSLRTPDAKVAERKALGYIADAHGLVDRARQLLRDGPPAGLPPELEAAFVADHTREFLEADERLRSSGLGVDLRAEPAPSDHDGLGMTDDDLSLYSFLIDKLDQDLRSQAAKMRPSETIGLTVNAALEKRGIVLEPDDPAWRKLEIGFLNAQRTAMDAIRARLRGENIPTPARAAVASTVTVRQALGRWAEGGGRGARAPRAGSVGEAAKAVRRFIELHGDVPITQVTKAHARAFRDALASLPSALPKKLADLPLPELLKRDLKGYRQRSATTTNKTLALLAAIFARADRDGYFEGAANWSNPFHVGLEIATTERNPYEPFSTEELKRLFLSPVFAAGQRPIGGKGEAAFWFPLIALFSGARRTEIAQLRVGDVREGEQGIWYFDFTNEGEDQNLKSASSARSVPVHSELIKFGLIKFAKGRGRRVGDEAPLWAGFEPPLGPKAKAWTKWFARYLGTHVVEDPAKTFHSFRHTFKRACREAGISEEVHNALTGHSGGGVGRRYGRERRADGSLDRGISLQRLSAEIEKVTYPGVLSA